MPERPALLALADRCGILRAYLDTRGQERQAPDTARMLILAAMGVDATSEESSARALEEIDRAEAARLVPPVRVIHVPAASTVSLRLPEAAGRRDRVEWSVDITEESGATHAARGVAQPQSAVGEVLVPLPAALPLGYHRLRAVVFADGAERVAEQTLIVAPEVCVTPAERVGPRGVFGLCTSLFSIRSRRNWGVGDLTDLAQLLAWCGSIGAEFAGLNPLHALRNSGGDISPYSPVSRLFRNVLYLDVEAIPELADAGAARAWLESAAVGAELGRLRAAARVDYEGVMRLKRPALAALHRAFADRHRGRHTPRGRAYARYREEQGDALLDFATFLSLDAHFATQSPVPPNWRAWPPGYRSPRRAEVEEFRRAHPEEVDFHCYLQFEIDRQLAEAAQAGREAGVRIGLYQDLAIGSARDGSDTWAYPDLFVDGVSVGAPPDAYAREGQDWGLPPADPRRLAEDGYRYWVRLVRASLAHAGALRIDHVMGLFRQYWVPVGHPASEGAYVGFPAEDLLSIVALESRRAGALIVGEDLGTVPPGLSETLQARGVLSSRVLYFEQSHDGFRPAAEYPVRALVTANTHDLPTLAGYWEGRDIELGRATGRLATVEAVGAAHAHRAQERDALLRRLAAEGVLPEATEPRSGAELRGAIHAFLCQTPAALVGLALDDVVGEVDPVNLPGIGLDRYPSWSRRLGVMLEDLPHSDDVSRALPGARTRRAL